MTCGNIQTHDYLIPSAPFNETGKSLDSIGHASPGLGLISAPHSALRGNTPSSVLPSSGDWSPNASSHSLSGNEFKVSD